MSLENFKTDKIIYKVVLTGGPCSGKTTGQARMSNFFEKLGWKVYRVPEAATVLLGGGIRFPELSEQQATEFQENLLKTMLTIEDTYFSLAESCNKNCLVICDRGSMDASAFISNEIWDQILKSNNWNTVELRDNRYDLVVHLVSAANGAEEFYTLEDNQCRTEGLELAKERDIRAAEAWVGHPYIDVIDNSSDFNTKISRLISTVCQRMGLDISDRLKENSHKLKFLVRNLPDELLFPPHQDFDVVHDYLITAPMKQARIRKRGQGGNWTYMITQRRYDVKDQIIEVKRPLSHKDYLNLLSQRDGKHLTVFKLRRCFIWNNNYFQLDIYQNPCPTKCKGLIILETYTTQNSEVIQSNLPSFLNVVKDVTKDPLYSMYNLSLVEDNNTKSFSLPNGHLSSHTT